MSKAFVKEDSGDDDDDGAEPSSPVPGGKNYITPQGLRRLRDELNKLLDEERPAMVKTVSWAASNGDRSENGDYIYGKRRLREIDKRVRFLSKRIDIAYPVDPAQQSGKKVLFGASVKVQGEEGTVESKLILILVAAVTCPRQEQRRKGRILLLGPKELRQGHPDIDDQGYDLARDRDRRDRIQREVQPHPRHRGE